MGDLNKARSQLAILGGDKVRKDPFPSWPQFDQTEEKKLLQVLHSRNWERHNGNLVSELEDRFAQLCGVDRSLMVSSGSTALPDSFAGARNRLRSERLPPL